MTDPRFDFWEVVDSVTAQPGALTLPGASDISPASRGLRCTPHGMPLNLIAVWARRLARLDSRVVVGEHTMMSGEALGGRRWFYDCPPALLHRAYLQADAVLAVSDGVAAELAAYADIPQNRITTVYNPAVGSHVAAMARSPLDHEWFMPGAPPIILGVGNFKPQKDFPTLIRAFAESARSAWHG